MAEKKKKEEVLVKQETAPEVEAPKYTIEEAKAIVNALNFEKFINAFKQVLVIGGIIMVVIMYIVTMDALFEMSVFGAIFNHSSYSEIWRVLTSPTINEEGEIIRSPFFDDWMRQGRWIPVTSISLFMILFSVAVLLGIAITFRDIFNVVRRLIKGSKKTLSTVATLAVDAATIDEDGNLIEVKKPSKKERKAKAKAEKRAREDAEYREIIGIDGDENLSESLDKLLGAEPVVDTNKEVESLFNEAK